MKKLISLLFISLSLQAAHPRLIMLGGGIFDILRKHPKWEYQIEYRSNYEMYENSWIFIRPLIGLMGTEEWAVYGYGGIAFDLFLGPYVTITPSFAPGLYYDGKGKSLGFPLEYRSTIEGAIRFSNEMRLGAQFYHISNGSVGRKNPGTESLVIFIAFPVF